MLPGELEGLGVGADGDGAAPDAGAVPPDGGVAGCGAEGDACEGTADAGTVEANDAEAGGGMDDGAVVQVSVPPETPVFAVTASAQADWGWGVSLIIWYR